MQIDKYGILRMELLDEDFDEIPMETISIEDVNIS